MARKPKIASVTESIDIPQPLEELSEREMVVWNKLCEILARNGLIHETDAIILGIICHSCVTLWDAQKELDAYKEAHNGSVLQTTPNGYSQVHNLFFAIEKHKEKLMKYLKEAGMTAASFTEISNAQKDAERMSAEDPLDAFLAKKGD